MRPLTHFIRAGLLGLALTLTLTPVAAQQTRGTFLAIPERFPDLDARAIVLRRAADDVVLLRAADATPEALAMTMLVLRRVREREPEPSTGQMIPITGYALSEELGDRRRVFLTRALDRLQATPVRDAGSLGPARWIRFDGR